MTFFVTPLQGPYIGRLSPPGPGAPTSDHGNGKKRGGGTPRPKMKKDFTSGCAILHAMATAWHLKKWIRKGYLHSFSNLAGFVAVYLTVC